MSKSTPLPNNNNNRNNKISPLPNKKFHQEENFQNQNQNQNDDDNNNNEDQQTKNNKTQQQLSPAPPSVGSPAMNNFARSGLLVNSQSPRVATTMSQSFNKPTSSSTREWKTKLGTGDRKVEMYAEDRKGAIERFTERLLEISSEDPSKSGTLQRTSVSPHKTKFVSSPTSLAGGGRSGGGGGGNSSMMMNQSARK